MVEAKNGNKSVEYNSKNEISGKSDLKKKENVTICIYFFLCFLWLPVYQDIHLSCASNPLIYWSKTSTYLSANQHQNTDTQKKKKKKIDRATRK